MLISRKIAALACFFTLFAAEKALTCASCGSGSDEPLILYPNEARKVYLGLTSTTGFRNADQSGAMASEGSGLERKTQFYLSSGLSLNERSFMTLGLPIFGNSGAKDTQYGLGDPLLSARYTLVPLNFAKERIPQVQLLASYKPGLSRSVHDSSNDEGLDVFGSGYHQVRAGVDIWSGLTELQFGLAQIMGYSFPKTISEHRLQPGLESRTVVSVGKVFESVGKLVLGGSRLYIAKLKDQGESVAHSEQINNALFFTSEYFIDQVSTARLTVARQAALLENRNTLRTDSVTFAYLRSF